MPQEVYIVYNEAKKELAFQGTRDECLIFLKGLEYGDNIDDSIAYHTKLKRITSN